MITLKACPVCQSTSFVEYKVMFGGYLICEIIPGVNVDARIITRYCVCHDCHLIFQNPRLSDAELDKYYSTGYYRQTINQLAGGMDASEASRAEIDAKIIMQSIGKVTSHLDIGCGRGYLLEAVDANKKIGVESDLDYVKVQGVEVVKNISQVHKAKFDLVTVIHVLEHLASPQDFLMKIKKFVSKKGSLVIEVPSWKAQGGPLGFAHLHFFETDVLKLMCKKAGLKVMQVEFTPHLMLICKV